MDVEVNELERLGKRLLVEFVQCVSDMAGVDLGVVGEISSDTGKNFSNRWPPSLILPGRRQEIS